MRIYEDLRGLQGRLDYVQYAIVGLMSALAVQFWYVQGVNSRKYREMAENNRFRTLTIAAPRGPVTDRSGVLLAENRPSFRIVVTPAPGEDIPALAAKMAPIIDADPLDLETRLTRPRAPYQPVTVKTGATFAHVAAVEARRAELPSVTVEVIPRRAYPEGPLAAHVLGRVGEVTDRQLEQPEYARLDPGSIVGQAGLELLYNENLTGADGTRKVIVNSRGVEMELAEDLPPRTGASMELTIGAAIQKGMERAFAGSAGSAVALDPFTGEVLGLVSLPAFDPNLFTADVPTADWQRLATDERTPLLNRVLQGQYSPGSLFKIVVATAGLEEGLVTPETTVMCPGAVSIQGHVFRCNQASGHGFISLARALAESCNSYFYILGSRLEIDRIASYARRYGLGRPTGIDLPREVGGLVPDSDWKMRLFKTPWYPGETISVAIGQGQISVTPIQMARMMAAIANGGQLVQPHVVRRVGPGPPPIPAAQPTGFAPSTLAAIRRGLFGTVNSGGSGARARVEGLVVAGKTGSAQVVSSERLNKRVEAIQPHAWFAGFAPYDAPRVALVVLVDNGGSGGLAAAPVAKAMFERIFNIEPRPGRAVVAATR